MKKTTFIIALLLSSFLFQTATAQVRIGLNVNIGIQPIWGPVGYDHVEYYYLPDIDAFYSVPKQRYIYQDHGRWIFSPALPPRYHDFDLYGGYKVVINDPNPYRHADIYRKQYGQYRGRHDQEIIRNSQESRYFENKDHPRHNEWKNNRGNDRRNKRDNRDRRDNDKRD